MSTTTWNPADSIFTGATDPADVLADTWNTTGGTLLLDTEGNLLDEDDPEWGTENTALLGMLADADHRARMIAAGVDLSGYTVDIVPA